MNLILAYPCSFSRLVCIAYLYDKDRHSLLTWVYFRCRCFVFRCGVFLVPSTTIYAMSEDEADEVHSGGSNVGVQIAVDTHHHASILADSLRDSVR